jgi:hypothetical protein
MGDEILWLRIYVTKDGDGSAEIGTQATEVEGSAFRAYVWKFWA